MHLSAEGKIGIALGLLGFGGTGVLTIAPAPWATRIGAAMIIIAAVGLLLLGAHHIIERRRIARKNTPKGAPSEEELRDLYERIEALKEKLELDEARYETSDDKVSYDTFHEVFAVGVRLLKLGIPIPFLPQYQEAVQYENYNSIMYQYFSAVSPMLRNGDLSLTKKWAKITLEQIRGRAVTNPPAAPPQAPEPPVSPGKT